MRTLAVVTLSLLAACAVPGPSVSAVTAELQVATGRFLASLDEAQRAAAQRPLTDAEATAWHFVPGRYAGVEMGALTPAQRQLAHDVLRTMLSATGFAKTMAIVDLERVLFDLESRPDRPAAHRDPDRYALLVCGDPSAGDFAVRFQGHHVSLRMFVVDGVLVAHTPHFLGTNPHRVPESHARPAALGREEDLARELLALLSPEQLAVVVFDPKAPADVLLGPGKEPTALGRRRGLAWREMRGDQRAELWELIERHAHVLRAPIARQELDRIRLRDLASLTFAWAGSSARGEGHYYRIHGAGFAIEYDCTQNGANHVHVVWRDFDRDMGGDALREHLEQQHR
ncbi:MAG: DUF3500 domain-containing protein [Planctomycetes bacterium]|nr:DUF3500 domain-containing protein [Planctomycetota bacterium]